jgi:hypothetical protein
MTITDNDNGILLFGYLAHLKLFSQSAPHIFYLVPPGEGIAKAGTSPDRIGCQKSSQP